VASASSGQPATRYLAERTPASRQTMATALKTLVDLLQEQGWESASTGEDRHLVFPWAELRRAHTLQLRERLRQRYAPATANKLLVALRGVLRVAQHLGQLSADEVAQTLDIPPIPEQAVRDRRVLSGAEVQALHMACTEDQTPAGLRDGALLLLLAKHGLRRAEVTALDLADVHLPAAQLVVRGGREGSTRTIHLVPDVTSALERWIAARGATPGPLFYGVTKGGGLVTRRLAPQAVAVICAARAAGAHIPLFTPEALRRTFVSSAAL
jgi:integrase